MYKDPFSCQDTARCWSMTRVTVASTHQTENLKTPKPEKVLRVGREIKAIHIRFPPTSRWSLLCKKKSYTCFTPKWPTRKDLDYPTPYKYYTDKNHTGKTTHRGWENFQSMCTNDLSSNSVRKWELILEKVLTFHPFPGHTPLIAGGSGSSRLLLM